jgi:hypothetical protein
MTRIGTLFISLALSVAVAILHITGEMYFFYWTYWWYDVLVHGIAGIAVGTLFAGTYHVRGTLKISRFLFIVGLTFAVGIFWEIFEYIIKSQQYEQFDPYVLDTLMDLGMDVAGGMTAYTVFKRLS